MALYQGPVQRLVALAAAAVLGLAGCGSDSSEDGSSDGGSSDSSGSSSQGEEKGSYPSQSKAACDIFTEAVGTKLLGELAPATNSGPGAETAGVKVTTCSHTNKTTKPSEIVAATLLLRAAQSDAGAASNEKVFDSLPTGAKDMSGYGDKAFWNPSSGQLHVLSKGNYYILQIGGLDARKNTVEKAITFADAIKSDF